MDQTQAARKALEIGRSLDMLAAMRRRTPKSVRPSRGVAGVLYVLPATFFIVVFFIVPLVLTVWMSFFDWPLLGERHPVGLANYASIGNDQQFWTSFSFTLRFTALVTPATLLTGFLLALIVRRPLRGVGVLRTAYFLPVVVGMGAASFIWYWMFNERVGVFDAVLRGLGLIDRPTQWLADPTTAFIAIAVMTVWKSAGFSMLMFLVGMHAIPDDLYEAARVDGASPRQSVRFITIPLLRSTFALLLVLTVIGGFLAFDQFYIMTRGGPLNQTITAVYWIFSNGFVYYRLGYGAALAVVLLVVLVFLSSVQMRRLRGAPEL
jgi:multiple sugar transport system permease protein